MPRLSNIEIKRFKRLVDVAIPLNTCTLLIGSNNAGKSSALQAIQFAVSLAQSAKLVGGVQWALDKYELSFGQNQLLYCPISDAMAIASGGALVEDANQRVEVRFELDNGVSSTVTLRKGRNRNLKVAIEGQELGEQLQQLSNPFSVYAPGLAGVPRAESYMNLGLIRRAVARGDANLVLRNVLLQLSNDVPKWNTFLNDMRELFPTLEVAIQFRPDEDEYIGVSVTHDGGPQIPLDAAGTSILQAAQLLSYVSLFQPKLLVLDEPDSHLHPDRQRKLCRHLCDIAEQRSFQLVMSSHSRHVLDALSRRAKIIWLSKGAVVPDVDVNSQKVLLDLGALDSVDYLADGHVRCLVATEDTDKRYINTLLEASGFPMDDVHVLSYPGCSQIEAAIVLGCFLREKANHIQLVVHRDRDYMEPAEIEQFENRLRAKGLHPWVTDRNDIESYFANPDHLSEANVHLAADRAQELLTQAIADTRDSSIEQIINLRIERAFKLRNRGGPNVNQGQISHTSHQEFDAHAESMSRGDLVLGRLTALIQQDLANNPVITDVTPYLEVPSLRAIKDQIWPPV